LQVEELKDAAMKIQEEAFRKEKQTRELLVLWCVSLYFFSVVICPNFHGLMMYLIFQLRDQAKESPGHQ
jgi:hypothetical protein